MLKAKSVGEYISVVEKLIEDWDALDTTTHPWFRGQRLSKWDLIPGLYRGKVNPLREREMLRDFKLKSSPYLKNSPKNDFEWMFIMQHYGMLTRLLDWTESHLYALYFAVSDYQGDDDACVWVLDPWTLNHHSIDLESVPVADDPHLIEMYCLENTKQTVLAELPVAVRPNYGSERIAAQRGVFTVHGKDSRGINVQTKEDKSFFLQLDKIVIPGFTKRKILRELHRAGINASTVFPELAGLCTEITFRYSYDYIEGGKKATSKWSPENLPSVITSKSRRSENNSGESSSRRRGYSQTAVFPPDNPDN